jgi:tetratricopeptide (TPR) repeat protein
MGAEHPDTLDIQENLARACDNAGELPHAEELFRAVLAGRRHTLGPEHPATMSALVQCGQNLNAQKRYSVAKALLRSGLTVCEKSGVDSWEHYSIMAVLGSSLVGEQKYAEAETLLLRAYEKMKERESQVAVRDRLLVKKTAERLGKLYHDQNRMDQARDWHNKSR